MPRHFTQVVSFFEGDSPRERNHKAERDNRSLKCAIMRIARSDIQDRTDSSLPRPLNYFLAVSVILITVNMCVGINKHRRKAGARSQKSGARRKEKQNL